VKGARVHSGDKVEMFEAVTNSNNICYPRTRRVPDPGMVVSQEKDEKEKVCCESLTKEIRKNKKGCEKTMIYEFSSRAIFSPTSVGFKN